MHASTSFRASAPQLVTHYLHFACIKKQLTHAITEKLTALTVWEQKRVRQAQLKTCLVVWSRSVRDFAHAPKPAHAHAHAHIDMSTNLVPRVKIDQMT